MAEHSIKGLENPQIRHKRELEEIKKRWEQYKKDKDICKLLNISSNCTQEELNAKKREFEKILHPDTNEQESEELKNWATQTRNELNELLGDANGWYKYKFDNLAQKSRQQDKIDGTNERKLIEYYLNNIIELLKEDLEAADVGNCIYQDDAGRKTKTSILEFVTRSEILNYSYYRKNWKSPSQLGNDTYNSIFEFGFKFKYDLERVRGLYDKKRVVVEVLTKIIELYKELKNKWYESHYVSEQYLKKDEELENVAKIINRLKTNQELSLELLKELEKAVQKLPHIGDFIKEKLVCVCLEHNIFKVIIRTLTTKVQEVTQRNEIPAKIREEIEYYSCNPYPSNDDMSTPEKTKVFVDKRVKQIWESRILPKLQQGNAKSVNIDPNFIYLINPVFGSQSNQKYYYFYLDKSSMQMYQIEDNDNVKVFSIRDEEMVQYISLNQMLNFAIKTDNIIDGLTMEYAIATCGYYFYTYEGKLLLKTTSSSKNSSENMQPLTKDEKEYITTRIAKQIAKAIINHHEEEKGKK